MVKATFVCPWIKCNFIGIVLSALLRCLRLNTLGFLCCCLTEIYAVPLLISVPTASPPSNHLQLGMMYPILGWELSWPECRFFLVAKLEGRAELPGPGLELINLDVFSTPVQPGLVFEVASQGLLEIQVCLSLLRSLLTLSNLAGLDMYGLAAPMRTGSSPPVFLSILVQLGWAG